MVNINELANRIGGLASSQQEVRELIRTLALRDDIRLELDQLQQMMFDADRGPDTPEYSQEALDNAVRDQVELIADMLDGA